MKSVLNMHEEMLEYAKRHAQAVDRFLQTVVEEGVCVPLSNSTPADLRYKVAKFPVGDMESPDPLKGYAGPDLRDLIYVDRNS